MTGQIYTGAPRATDANGKVIPAAKMYFYATGTNTFQTVYADTALTTALSNPVLADAGGRYPTVYLNAALVYRAYETNSSGTPTGLDIDPCSSTLSGSSGASFVGATDGANNAKWSNLQGFVNYLLSSSGASAIGTASGLGVQIDLNNAVSNAVTQATSAATASSASAANSASQALAALAIKNNLGVPVTAGGTLPNQVLNITGGGGTGGTPGTYTGSVSGTPFPGFQWQLVVGSNGISAPQILTNGLSTSATVPTLVMPTVTGLTGATTPIVTVGAIPSGTIFFAPDAAYANSLAWGSNAGVLASAPFGGTQATSPLSSSIAALIASLSQTQYQYVGRPASVVPITGSATGAVTYMWANPVAQAGLLTGFQFFALATGTVTLNKYTISGGTATRTWTSGAIAIGVTGLQTLTPTQFNGGIALTVAPNEYISFYGSGIVSFTTNIADGIGWYQFAGNSPTNTSIGTLQTTYRLEAQPIISYVVQIVTASSFASLSATVAPMPSALALLSSTVAQTISRPLSATLVGGSAVSTSVYVSGQPVSNTGTIASLDLFALATGTATIYRYTLSSGVLSPVANQSVTIVGTGQQSVAVNMAVNAGDYIGVYGPGIFGFSTGTQDSIWYFTAISGGTVTAQTPYVFQLRLNLTGSAQTVTASALVALQGSLAGASNSLSLGNVDQIAIVSNSYHEAAATLLGKAAVHNVSDLSEYNFVNYSKGGQTMAQLASLIAGGTALYGTTFAASSPKYAIICENQNSKGILGQTDAQYYTDTQIMIDTVRSFGATPIVASEWGSSDSFPSTIDGEQRNLRGMRAIADDNRLIMIDGTSKSRTMNNRLYAPFYKSQHPGTRVSHIISDALQSGLKQLSRPSRSMKIFRVRGTVTVTGVANLIFRSLQDRKRLFKEIYIGQMALAPGYTINYDIATNLYEGTLTQNSEYNALRTGSTLALGTYALVDCVLPLKAVTGITVTLSDTTITVYARKMTNTGISWVALSLLNGMFIVPDNALLVADDRITLLLYNAGGILLNASPVISWTGGVSRVIPTSIIAGPPKGAEMMAQPFVVVSGAIPGAWTNTGGLTVDTLVDGTAYLPSPSTGAVTVTSAAGLSQAIGAFTASDDPQEIVVRVWARYCPLQFVPIQTTVTLNGTASVTVASSAGMSTGMVFAGVGIPSSPATTITVISGTNLTISQAATASGSGVVVYAANAASAPITPETCDTATLQVTLSGPSGIGNASAVLKDQVGLNWREVEFRSTIEAYDTSVTIDVRSADLNIEIAKVSVRLS